jgi:alkylated DNA repair dioxygenase AlkB
MVSPTHQREKGPPAPSPAARRTPTHSHRPPAKALRQATLAFGQKATAATRPGRASVLRPAPGRLDLSSTAHLLYLPAHFPPADADALLNALRTEVDWLARDVTVWGRTVPQKRLVAYQADRGSPPYAYSGLTLVPSPWTPAVQAIRAAVETIAGTRFDTCLLNLYRDGRDCMGWHADNEVLYGPPSSPKTIASASFGSPRAFQLRPTPGGTADNGPSTLPASRIEYELGRGDVLLMCGTAQRDWQHAVPARVRAGGVRVNLTFRATVVGGGGGAVRGG